MNPVIIGAAVLIGLALTRKSTPAATPRRCAELAADAVFSQAGTPTLEDLTSVAEDPRFEPFLECMRGAVKNGTSILACHSVLVNAFEVIILSGDRAIVASKVQQAIAGGAVNAGTKALACLGALP